MLYFHSTPLYPGQRAGSLVQFNSFWLSHMCDAALPTFCAACAALRACLFWLCQAASSPKVLGRFEHWHEVEPIVAAALEGNITGQDMVGDVLSHSFIQLLNCAPPLLLTNKTAHRWLVPCYLRAASLFLALSP
jgi:hypothetical protein